MAKVDPIFHFARYSDPAIPIRFDRRLRRFDYSVWIVTQSPAYEMINNKLHFPQGGSEPLHFVTFALE